MAKDFLQCTKVCTRTSGMLTTNQVQDAECGWQRAMVHSLCGLYKHGNCKLLVIEV